MLPPMMLPVPFNDGLAVEQEDHHRQREQRRRRERQIGQPAEGVGGERQAQDAENGDDLEGHAVRKPDAEHRDDDRRG